MQLLRPFRAPGIPTNEGTAPAPHGKYGLFEIIADGVTDINGTVTFHHLVKNVGAADRYSLRVFSDPNNPTANYYQASIPVSHQMLLDDPLGWDNAVFNEDYQGGRVYRAKVPVSPKPPMYAGTVVRADTRKPMPQALMVLVQPGVGGTMILHAVKPEDDGKFVITGLEANRQYVVRVHSPGFRPDSNVFTADSGVVNQFDHQLQPEASVTISLVDEHGAPVPGRVNVGAGQSVDAQPVFGNDQGQQLMPIGNRLTWSAPGGGGQPAPPSGGQARATGGQARAGAGVQMTGAAANATAQGLHLIAWRATVPASSGKQTVHVDAGPDYFPTDTAMTIAKGASDLGKVMVYLRMRRLKVKVVALKATPPAARRMTVVGQPRVIRIAPGQSAPAIKGATVQLPNEPGRPSATTDASGTVTFEWKATSVDSFEQVTVEITPPPGSDFLSASPQVPVPESRTPSMSVLGLASGATIQGTVYAGAGTDSILPGARVFLAGAGPGGGDLSDVSDAKGHYALHGAPTGQHLVRAAKAASSFVGDSAQVTTAVGTAATRDFHLTAVADGLPATLLGFTAEIQGYRKSGQGAVLSGHLTSLPTGSDFAPTESGRTLQFDSVLVSATGGNAVPVGGAVHLVDSDLPLVLFGKYLVRQHQHGGIDVTDQGGGQGALKAPVALLPGSFAVTTAALVFLDSLHLLDPGATGAARTRIATLAAGGVSTAPAAGYNVGTVQGGDSKLTVDGFPADAAASGSHLTADALHLDATLHTAIPGLADLAIHVGNLTVTPGTGAGAGLQDAKGDQPLSLTLGQWTLDAPTWSLGKGRLALVQGAVRVPMTAGKPASVIDFPFTGMSVTPTSLEGGHFGGGPILLGGFVPLSVAGDISFLRDTPTSPWKLFGGGGQIAALPGMATGDEIRVQSWRFMSNGEKHFSMEPGGHVQLYHTGDMALSTLGITESTVSFAGGLDLHVPGLAPQAAVIDYTRPVSSAPPVFKFNPIDIAPFDIGGPLVSVHQGILDASGFHGDGTVEVPQKFAVKSAFLRSPLGPAEKIQALPRSGATLDVGQIAISALQGGAKVAGGKWATNYQGHLDVGGQVSGDLSIGVQGTDVNAGTGGLAVKNIPTPFGNMAITMNFPKQRLEGSVEMEKDIAAGAHVKGTSEMVISGDPAQRYWYLFTGAGFSLKTPHLSGSAALLIGDATLDADLLGRFRKYGKRDVPAVFHTVHGFFLEGAASIPVPVCPNGTFDIGVADVEVWCNVTGDVRLGASFDKANTYLIGIGAGIDAGVKGGIGMGLCVHVSAEVKALLDGEGAYRSDGAWYARGQASIDLRGSASYGVGLDDICLDDSKSISIGLGAEAQVGYDWAAAIGPHTKVWFK